MGMLIESFFAMKIDKAVQFSKIYITNPEPKQSVMRIVLDSKRFVTISD